MEKNVKIIVFAIFAILLIFLIFGNIRGVEEAARSVPSNEDLAQFSNVQAKNEANSYEVKDIQNKELATIYYNHFKNLVVNNEEEAYERIRNKSDVSMEEFEAFRINLINNYYGSRVENYQIINGNDSSTYRIINNDNQTIVFYVDAVFKYEIELFI